MTYRAAVLKIHLWLAIAATIPLVLLGGSGAVVTFEQEIDRLLNPTLLTVAPQSAYRPWQDLIERVEKEYPRARAGAVRLPQRDDWSAEVSLRNGLLVYVNPYDGAVLGDRRRSDIVTAKIHQFHTNLLLGEPGSKVQGTTAVVLVVLSLSGLVLWWRTKAWKFSWQSTAARLWYDLHSALGLYGMIFWLVMATTGAMMTFEYLVEPALYRVAGSVPPPPALRSAAANGRQVLSVDRVIELAQEKLPGAAVTMVSLPTSSTDVHKVFLKYSEDRTPAGRSRVFLDAYSGAVVWAIDTRNVPLGSQIWHRHRSWHTGDQWGWTGRLLMGAASLLLIVQTTSGIVWWQRRRLLRSEKSVAP